MIETVRDLIAFYSAETVLDYGCGKGGLRQALRLENTKATILEYDPAITGKDKTPDPADVVICRDVLEHIEPECLEDVLLDLRRVTKKCLYVLIATRLSKDILSDGTNAHRIIQQGEWWKEKISKHFKIIYYKQNETRECMMELV